MLRDILVPNVVFPPYVDVVHRGHHDIKTNKWVGEPEVERPEITPFWIVLYRPDVKRFVELIIDFALERRELRSYFLIEKSGRHPITHILDLIIVLPAWEDS